MPVPPDNLVLQGRSQRREPGGVPADPYEQVREVVRMFPGIQKLIDIADGRGKTPAQVATAWVLDHPEITSAMIGPDGPEQVDESLGAVGWRLTEEERAILDAASEPDQSYIYL